jgi:hypothetical protein
MSPSDLNQPRTVLGAKRVEIALVTYTDETNTPQTQLAIIGENNVHLLEGRAMGLSKVTTPQGNASSWLRDAIMAKLAAGKVKK